LTCFTGTKVQVLHAAAAAPEARGDARSTNVYILLVLK
jgi:hypothetical protein